MAASVTLRVFRWSQGAAERVQEYRVGAEADTTVLDALVDIQRAQDATLAFRYACRVGMCGSCAMVVNGRPAMGCTSLVDKLAQPITLEPLAKFPVVRDLVVDRSALDRLVQAGGYVSVRTGSAADAGALPVARDAAERALDAAVCIGCGACVAACPNGAASLFVGAKLTHLAALPQGQPERGRRTRALVAAADHEGFGGCTLHGECQAACPQHIDLGVIARLNRDYLTDALARWWGR